MPNEIKIAIIGRPNVGKSTLLNQLTESDRAIVSSIAGTTRDAIDEVVEHGGKRYRFIDTAGIRRKGKTHLMAEKMSVVMAQKASGRGRRGADGDRRGGRRFGAGRKHRRVRA